MSKFQILFLQLGICGYFSRGAGTIGSIIATIIAIPIMIYTPSILFVLGVVLIFISVPIIDKYEAIYRTHDSNSITIDEASGVFIALGMFGSFSIAAVILCFISFRILDIYKPSIIGKIDKNLKGGLGVMLDDALAGFFAGLISLGIIAIFSKFGINL